MKAIFCLSNIKLQIWLIDTLNINQQKMDQEKGNFYYIEKMEITLW